MTRREELLPTIRHLRDVDGLPWWRIGALLGLSLSTVNDYYSDPDGSRARARKAKTNGTCEDCGGPTISDGSKVGKVCSPCAHRREHEGRWWTAERIVEAINRWADEHGGIPPAAGTWQNGTRPDWAPNTGSVQREFGSWSAAIEAAGFEPQRHIRWTHEDVLLAIRTWTRTHGAPPRRADWRWVVDDFPTETTVINYFGSWRAAIEAAERGEAAA